MKTGFMKRIASIAAAACVFAFSVTTAFAADSPVADLAPELGMLDDGNGNTSPVLFVDEEGNTFTLPDGFEIQIRDLAEVDQGELAEITEMLLRTEEEIKAVTLLNELTPDIDALIAAYNAENPDSPVTAEGLRVIDIFDISLVRLNAHGNDDYVVTSDNIPSHITATFQLTFPYEVPDFYILLHEYTADQWKAETDITRISSNTLRITVDDFSPFALIVHDDTNGDYNDPGTGDGNTDSGDGNSDPTPDGNGSQGGTSQTGTDSNLTVVNITLGVSAGLCALIGAFMLLTRNKDEKGK